MVLIPQVTIGIIIQDMEKERSVNKKATKNKFVVLLIKHKPKQLISVTMLPTKNNLRIPILSYIFPAKGLVIAIVKEPGNNSSPENVAELPRMV
jgi:hypothetical protein